VAGGSPEKSRLAALVRHGSDPAAVARAREALAAVNLRKAINTQCAALGLPPAASDFEALGYAASLLTRAGA
jgi:hypothetical protein